MKLWNKQIPYLYHDRDISQDFLNIRLFNVIDWPSKSDHKGTCIAAHPHSTLSNK